MKVVAFSEAVVQVSSQVIWLVVQPSLGLNEIEK
jgi:hypothetical protein